MPSKIMAHQMKHLLKYTQWVIVTRPKNFKQLEKKQIGKNGWF